MSAIQIRERSLDFCETFPEELSLMVFKLLDSEAYLNATLVNKTWKRFCGDKAVKEPLYQAHLKRKKERVFTKSLHRSRSFKYWEAF